MEEVVAGGMYQKDLLVVDPWSLLLATEWQGALLRHTLSCSLFQGDSYKEQERSL